MAWVAQLPKLEALNLNYTPVTDAGIAQLSKNTAFSELKLDRTDLTDKSLSWLTAQKNLKYLDLYHTQLSEQGFKSVKKALPNAADQLEPRRRPHAAENVADEKNEERRTKRERACHASPARCARARAPASRPTRRRRRAGTSDSPAVAHAIERIEQRGGWVARDKDGTIVEVSLERTWATDNDIDFIVELKTIKKLDLSFTYVTDRGIKKLQALQQLEDLTLDTAEFLTDASMAHLRANRALRRLVVRGVDITDAGMPYVGEMTGLRSLDISYTMLGDVGLEHLPDLSELEHLKIGATLITGLNLNFLKLLPKLKSLSLRGVQRRNAGACWTPNVTDLDLETISLLSGLEELDLGVGIKLGMGGKPAAPGGGNCTLTGGLQITDLGVAKLAKLKNLKRLNISGARLTPEGLQVLQSLPLERLSVWASHVARRCGRGCARGHADARASRYVVHEDRRSGAAAAREAAEPESALPDRNQRHAGSG